MPMLSLKTDEDLLLARKALGTRDPPMGCCVGLWPSGELSASSLHPLARLGSASAVAPAGSTLTALSSLLFPPRW